MVFAGNIAGARMSEYRLPNIAGHWTVSQLDTCITLWRAGNCARYIAERTGKSRNAVIGKMGRLHITKGEPAPKPILRIQEPEPEPQPEPRPLPEPIDYAARICSCNNHGPCQPGRGLCEKCINARKKPNQRAAMWPGPVKVVA